VTVEQKAHRLLPPKIEFFRRKGFEELLMGTNRTLGLSPLAMMISSPWHASSMRRERLVLAGWIVIVFIS